MNVRSSLLLVACLALFLCACGSSPQSLIVGKWVMDGAKVGGADAVSATTAGRAIRMTALFGGDGTATMTMLGHAFRGTYKLNSGT